MSQLNKLGSRETNCTYTGDHLIYFYKDKPISYGPWFSIKLVKVKWFSFSITTHVIQKPSISITSVFNFNLKDGY